MVAFGASWATKRASRAMKSPNGGRGGPTTRRPPPPRPPMGLGDEGDRLIAHRTRLDRPIESAVWGALGVVLFPPYAP